MIAGIGVAILGFVGKRNRVNVLVLAAGTALVFAVRPQVAVVLLFAFVAGHWLFALRGAYLSRVAQGGLVAIMGVGVLLGSAEHSGPDPDGCWRCRGVPDWHTVGGSAHGGIVCHCRR